MVQKLQRVGVMLRVVGVLIILGLLGYVAYQVYDFYTNRMGLTPNRIVETYFDALAQGNETEVYRLTAKDRLTDIYGRPITQSEFYEQLRRITGGRQLPFTQIEVKRLFEERNARYYEVTLHSNVGGAPGVSRILVEAHREGGSWVITYPFPIIL